MMPVVWAAVAVGLMAGGGFAGYRIAADRCEAKVARVEADFAAEREATARETARRLAAAQEAESRAVTALHATKARLAASNRRLKEALYGLPTAQFCGLSAHARGMLNRAITSGDGLPARADQPDSAPAASAADPGEPTGEAELAGWIADAISAYDDCRARIDAIRQWDAEVNHGR